jgi:hypothetical protein
MRTPDSIGNGLFLGEYRNYTPFIWNPSALGPSVSVQSALPFSGQLSFSAAMNYNGPSDNYDVICYAPIVSVPSDSGDYFGYRMGWQVIGSNFTTTSPSGGGFLTGTWPLYTTALSITLTGSSGTTTTPSYPALVLPISVGDADFKLKFMPPYMKTGASFYSPFNSFVQVQSQSGGSFLNLGYNINYRLPVSDFGSGIYRSALQVPTGQIAFQFKDSLRFNLGLSYKLSYGSGLPYSRTDTNGSCTLSNAPLGGARINIQRQVTVVSPTSGATNSVGLEIPMDFTNLHDQVMALIDADLEAFVASPCDCTAWCGIAAATVDGVQTVIASGGKIGTCLEEAEVTITGPGGVSVTFPDSPFPRRKRQQFSPAADGTWTVTASICGQSKTCTITLP